VPETQEIMGLLIDVTDRGASSETLFPFIDDELRRLVHHQLQQEPPGHVQQATSLVHEVYLRLVYQTRDS
jgi:hypothetical protein